MAGESAQEQAERRLAKAEKLIESAQNWQKGADGEAATAAALAELEESPGWTVLHDLPWPGRQRANIDHVAIGPSGLYVIDSKNWSGKLTVTSEELRQDGRLRADAVTSVASAAQAVAFSVPGLDAAAVQPMLCFAREEWLTDRIGDVSVCTTQNVVALLKTRRDLLDRAECERLAKILPQALENARPEVPTPRPAAARPAGAAAPVPASPARQRRHRSRRRPPIGRAVAGLGLIAVVLLKPDAFAPVANYLTGVVAPDDQATNDDPTKPAKDKSTPDDKSKNQEKPQDG